MALNESQDSNWQRQKKIPLISRSVSILDEKFGESPKKKTQKYFEYKIFDEQITLHQSLYLYYIIIYAMFVSMSQIDDDDPNMKK